jgi:hypothetical protein
MSEADELAQLERQWIKIAEGSVKGSICCAILKTSAV